MRKKQKAFYCPQPIDFIFKPLPMAIISDFIVEKNRHHDESPPSPPILNPEYQLFLLLFIVLHKSPDHEPPLSAIFFFVDTEAIGDEEVPFVFPVLLQPSLFSGGIRRNTVVGGRHLYFMFVFVFDFS